jgi:hypothetical protein
MAFLNFAASPDPEGRIPGAVGMRARSGSLLPYGAAPARPTLNRALRDKHSLILLPLIERDSVAIAERSIQ